jgi:hypothetical protein
MRIDKGCCLYGGMPADIFPLSAESLSALTLAERAWMAGLLEGEGYFFFNSNHIGVRLSMTDRDVVQRFADFWQVPIRALKPTAAHHKIAYLAHLPSKKAMQCMRLVKPFLGARRTVQVDDALTRFQKARAESRRNLRSRMQGFTNEDLITAWQMRNGRESIRAFCRRVGASSRTTVTDRLRELGLLPTLDVLEALPERSDLLDEEPVDLRLASADVQSAWMAGLLEGEACFTCAGACVAVALKMTDRDVVECYASLAGIRGYPGAPARQVHHKPIFIAIASGRRGAAVMERILSFMGERRSSKIRECLHQRKVGLERLRELREAARARYEAQFPAEDLVPRWTKRTAGETLSTFSREYGVHPQVMKNRLVALGIYEAPVYKARTFVDRWCEFCSAGFTRPASFRGGQFCSRVCSGRAQAQRRAAQRAASLGTNPTA